MKKILLLTTAILLSSASVYSACDPNLPACQCSYPKMVNGIIGCSETYCETGTKCMPDGSCCPNDNYCESTEKGKECCSAEQICDTTKGCVEKKADIETLCANAEGGGTIVTATSGTFCMSNDTMTWYEAEEWCRNNGMTMPTMKEMCPSWDGSVSGSNNCPELKDVPSVYVWSATLVSENNEQAFAVFLSNSGVNVFHRFFPDKFAFCH